MVMSPAPVLAMIRFSNPGIHPGPGRLKGGRAGHASDRIRLRDPWRYRSGPSCGARPRSAAARPGGGGPDTGMNRGGGGRQEAGFPREPQPAPKLSTATPWFVSRSRNMRGARLHGPGRGVPEGAASLTGAVPDCPAEGPVRGAWRRRSLETRGVCGPPTSVGLRPPFARRAAAAPWAPGCTVRRARLRCVSTGLQPPRARISGARGLDSPSQGHLRHPSCALAAEMAGVALRSGSGVQEENFRRS